jgi:hypothetical protein
MSFQHSAPTGGTFGAGLSTYEYAEAGRSRTAVVQRTSEEVMLTVL